MRKFVRQLIVGVAVMTLLAPSVMADDDNHYRKYRRAKNVIVLIPDGCDESVQTLARWYKGEDLQVDSMQGGSVKIHMANSVITGSAAAATAFATGHKTTARFIGIGPRTSDLLTSFEPTAAPYAPVASVLEAAKLKRKATGLVATSRISHATPAAFASHIEDRGWDNDIIEHMVYNNIDVVFGGGARHLFPKYEKDGETLFQYTTSFGDTWGGKRTDGQNLMDVLLDRGYQFVDSKDGMDAVYSGKVWGLFDDSHLDADIDREMLHPNQPSIAEMTEKAIELLSQDRNGFFLMVEGSQVDWAGHNNDPIYMVTDFLAFDAAVKVAVDFAKRDHNTIVLAFPDHNTGGMTIGNRIYNGGTGYTNLSEEALIDPLMGMTMTSGALVAQMGGAWDVPSIQAAVLEHWGIDCSADVAQEIMDLVGPEGIKYNVSKNYALARVISKHYTPIGWTSHGHDGGTVPVWAYGLDIDGTLDNTELAEIMADELGLNLKRTTKRLFVDIAKVTEDYEIDLANDMLKVGDASFPLGADHMIVNGNTISLPGVTVYASGDDDVAETVYISKKAIKILKWTGQI